MNKKVLRSISLCTLFCGLGRWLWAPVPQRKMATVAPRTHEFVDSASSPHSMGAKGRAITAGMAPSRIEASVEPSIFTVPVPSDIVPQAERAALPVEQKAPVAVALRQVFVPRYQLLEQKLTGKLNDREQQHQSIVGTLASMGVQPEHIQVKIDELHARRRQLKAEDIPAKQKLILSGYQEAQGARDRAFKEAEAALAQQKAQKANRRVIAEHEAKRQEAFQALKAGAKAFDQQWAAVDQLHEDRRALLLQAKELQQLKEAKDALEFKISKARMQLSSPEKRHQIAEAKREKYQKRVAVLQRAERHFAAQARMLKDELLSIRYSEDLSREDAVRIAVEKANAQYYAAKAERKKIEREKLPLLKERAK